MKKSATKKLVNVSVRGCVFRVTKERAAELLKEEREMLKKEMAANNLAE
jgi:hypothetical protein